MPKKNSVRVQEIQNILHTVHDIRIMATNNLFRASNVSKLRNKKRQPRLVF